MPLAWLVALEVAMIPMHFSALAWSLWPVLWMSPGM